MTPEQLKLDRQLCFRLYAASRNMTRVYQPLLQPHGLTYPQYLIMLILFEHKTMDFKELSTMIDLKTATLTPIIQKMTDMGLVLKEKNPTDGRRINVHLTDRGQDMQESLSRVPLDLAEQIGMSLESYETLVTELDGLLNKLNRLQK